jgi:hypothetical protein
MRLLFRKLMIFAVAAGLAFSGATPHSHAKMALADAASPHEAHAVPHYTALAIEAGDDDSVMVAFDCPNHTSNDNDLCKTCCAACVSPSIMPSAPFPIPLLSEIRETFSIYRVALVAHKAAIDPSIPKPL